MKIIITYVQSGAYIVNNLEFGITFYDNANFHNFFSLFKLFFLNYY